jgi:poly-beta-1,6-N-acetyl-D-glucosamine synthase
MMATLVIVLICGVILLLYIFRISAYSFAIWKYTRQTKTKDLVEEIKVTLLIPFRNEEKNLPNIILDTQIQLYPSTYSEVIFINDHSEDGSVAILERLLKEADNIRMIHLPEQLYGKKAAISYGVNHASGDWIIQTDADCRIRPGFISEHVRAAMNNMKSFIAGPVLLRESKDLWNQMEVLEFMSLTGSTMGSFLTERPVMCNGANISYSKEFYLSNERGLSMINSPSGDDMFLMAKAKKAGLNTAYLLTEQSVAVTTATGSPLAFLRQRIRWGSKARFYRDIDILTLAAITFLANASLLGFLIYGILDPTRFFLFGIFLLIKSLADLLLMIVTTKHFQKPRLLWYFPLVALFYYFYLVITGVLSLVAGYKWKGRKY